MLLTMLQAYEDDNDIMPNEERLDKVDESMANLEEVVRERNRAYYDLEVGDWRGEQACADSFTVPGFWNTENDFSVDVQLIRRQTRTKII